MYALPIPRSKTRAYYLTPDRHWVRHTPYGPPGHGLTEVTPREVIRDLRERGITIPAELAESELLPRWDPDERRLWYDEIVCRDFGKRRAPAQMAIVEAFHNAEWGSPIRAPFSDKQLRDTIGNLNKSLGPDSPIVFKPNGPDRMTWMPL
jgi:hypothetical protein